jgi:hypothetical protein
MGRTTDLRRAIKRSFVPLMEGKGFRTDSRDLPHFLAFRRITPDRIYVCDIQWEKYGRPRFVLNFGSCGSQGVVCHGKEINPADVTASATPWRGRLMPGRPPSISRWFRQDRSLLQGLWKGSSLRPPDETIRDLIDLFTEVEDFWNSGIIGKHIQVLTVRWSVNKVAR